MCFSTRISYETGQNIYTEPSRSCYLRLTSNLLHKSIEGKIPTAPTSNILLIRDLKRSLAYSCGSAAGKHLAVFPKNLGLDQMKDKRQRSSSRRAVS